MFDKLKQLNELRKMQGMIKNKRAEAEKNGVKVAIAGDFEIISLALNPELDIHMQEKAVIAAYNDARNKMQQQLAKDFAGKLF